MCMSGILGSLLLGVSFLAIHAHAMPIESETVISQLTRTIYGSEGFLYLATIAGITVILVMAANTAFVDFPRLGALAAADGFLPRQLSYRGSRLVYSRGIVALAMYQQKDSPKSKLGWIIFELVTLGFGHSNSAAIIICKQYRSTDHCFQRRITNSHSPSVVLITS